MKLVCPVPLVWNAVFKRLTRFARTQTCVPPTPPVPLILAGWAYSNDLDKLRRWDATVAWARRNGCSHLVDVPESDFYCSHKLSSYAIGPLGGPMFRRWDFEPKERPSQDQRVAYLETLSSRWSEIAGLDLAPITRPLSFTGAKARRLLVHADSGARPPWGGWFALSSVESERRSFTRLRAAINRAIAPHEVDHVDFITVETEDGFGQTE